MDILTIVAALLLLIVGGVVLFWFTRRHKAGWDVALRPLPGFRAMAQESEKAIETGRSVQLTLGRADLAGPSSPTSIAALEALEFLAQSGARGDTVPETTVGDGTLLLAAQDGLRSAYREVGRSSAYSPSLARFIAGRDFAMSYAAGVSQVINEGEMSSNVLLGRFGVELAIMAEAGERLGHEQIIGSDDPQALAIAVAVTDKVLIGEELFAAGAYLQKRPSFLASLQLQDILRVVAIVLVLLVALLEFIL